MNNVTLVGRITKTPELRTIASGQVTTNITVAVNRTFTNANGEREADFIPVVIWGKQAENTAQYMSKGSQIAISGRITTRSYDAKDGTKRYVTEVVADTFNGVSFLSKGNGGSNNGGSFNGGGSDYSHSADDVFGGMGFDNDMTPVDDGDMPF